MTAFPHRLADGLAGPRAVLLLTGEIGPRAAIRHRLLAKAWWRSAYRFADGLYGTIWRDAARVLDADVVEQGDGFLEIRRDGRSTWVRRHVVMIDDVVTRERALNRAIVHRLLAESGVPVPRHLEFTQRDMRPALEFLASADGPCVVKPSAGTSGGRGISPGVRTPRELFDAVGIAGRFDARLMIERQLPGPMYRLLFLDGELLDAVRRPPPTLTGDGRTSVVDLIDRENRRRLAAEGRAGLQLLRPDLDSVWTLRARGLSMRSVPSAGEVLVVKASTSENGASNEPAANEFAEEAVAQCAGAARAAGVRLAGIDVIAADPGRPLDGTSGAVIEVNCGPGLHYHYQLRDPAQRTPVAEPVLRRLLRVA